MLVAGSIRIRGVIRRLSRPLANMVDSISICVQRSRLRNIRVSTITISSIVRRLSGPLSNGVDVITISV